ncbi:MAG: hypothetical protein IJ379_04035 [Lachnospiraceae bacterium]|nr:hypothetical protein [Lachnospiraceae bacterium]
MEHLIFILTMVVFALFIFGQGVLNEKKQIAYYKQKLRNCKGDLPDKEYKVERFLRIPGYYEKHQEEFQIDDITWNDLSMDDIFVRMNYAISSTGEEYLYYMLRTPQFEEQKLKHFDELVEYYSTHDDERIEYQWLMKKLGTTGKFSLYDYIGYLERLGKRSNKKDIISLCIGALLIVVCFFELTLGILGLIVWMLYQMFSYFKIKNEIEPYVISLAYMMRLLDVADKAIKMLPQECAEEKLAIEQARKQLNKSKHGAFIVFNSVESGKTGSIVDAVFDYLRMTFHLDLIFFNHMLGELMHHIESVDMLITKLGYLESAVCVGLYRASLQEGWCKPQLGAEVLQVEEGYHPLIIHPIKNSITARRSVLLTGSNASGKSTFLKMMALSSLLAQTVCTVTADKYEAPFYYLYSSMSLRDDLESGESYYIVEIKSIKRILENRKLRKGKILCFVDEVLRGTNTVERIAASTQILLSMTGEDIQCFAATHDIELTQLLENVYENYHFEEEIKDGDVLFNYQLRGGKATTRNAIKLLEIMGYERQIIEHAKEQADTFLSQGVWKCP